MDQKLHKIRQALAVERKVCQPRLEGYKYQFHTMVGATASVLMFPMLDIHGPIIGTVSMVIAGVLGWVGARLSIGRDHEPWELIVNQGLDITPQHMWKVMETGLKQVHTLYNMAPKINDRYARMRVEQAADVAERIFDQFMDDPSDIRRSTDFLAVFLPKSIEIVEKYVKLEKKQGIPIETMTEVRAVLDTLENTFEQQYQKNLTNDTNELSIVAEALDKRMQLSGI